jgi:hypothetical protein
MLVEHTLIPMDIKLTSHSMHVSTHTSQDHLQKLATEVMVLLNTKRQVVICMLKKAITGTLHSLLHVKKYFQ